MGSLSQVTPAQLCPGTAQLVPSSAQAGEQDSPRQGSGFAHRVGSRGRAGHSLPGSALGGCDPAQPPTQLTQAVSTQHWGTAPSGCMDTPQTSHPWHNLSPATGYLPLIFTHWHEQPLVGADSAAWHPAQCLTHLWDAKGKSKSPPAFDEISLSYKGPFGLWFCFPHAPWWSGSHTLWEKQLERSVDIDFPTGDFLPPSKLVHDCPRAEINC